MTDPRRVRPAWGVWIPILVTLGSGVLFAIPSQRAFGRWYIHENGPIEMCTFLAFLAGGIVGLAAWGRARTRASDRLALVLLVFALGWLFAAGEEVSWGQSLMGFASPHGWQEFNEQDEINVHNVVGVQNLHSFFLFALGAGGVAWAIVTRRRRDSLLRLPPASVTCFAIVAVLGGLDWLTDNYPFGAPADTVIGMLTEVNEMILSWAGLFFAVHLWRRLRAAPRTAANG